MICRTNNIHGLDFFDPVAELGRILCQKSLKSMWLLSMPCACDTHHLKMLPTSINATILRRILYEMNVVVIGAGFRFQVLHVLVPNEKAD